MVLPVHERKKVTNTQADIHVQMGVTYLIISLTKGILGPNISPSFYQHGHNFFITHTACKCQDVFTYIYKMYVCI